MQASRAKLLKNMKTARLLTLFSALSVAAAACAGWWVVCAVLLAVAAAWCAALLGAAASAAEGGPAVRSRFRVKNFTVS